MKKYKHIICSIHSINRVIERVKKINNKDSAYIYLNDKLIKLFNKGFSRKGMNFIYKKRLRNNQYIIKNKIHTIIYEKLNITSFKIITYYINV